MQNRDDGHVRTGLPQFTLRFKVRRRQLITHIINAERIMRANLDVEVFHEYSVLHAAGLDFFVNPTFDLAPLTRFVHSSFFKMTPQSLLRLQVCMYAAI